MTELLSDISTTQMDDPQYFDVTNRKEAASFCWALSSRSSSLVLL